MAKRILVLVWAIVASLSVGVTESLAGQGYPAEMKKLQARGGGPQVGDVAPDFRIKGLDGKTEIQLSTLKGRLVVLFFGSYSCPIFRGGIDPIKELHAKYTKTVEFVMVYVDEAHPIGGIPAVENDRENLHLKLATTWEEKAGHAKLCVTAKGMQIPTVVDELDNSVQTAYAAWPTRMYLVGRDGRVVYRGPASVVDAIRPAEVEAAITSQLKK